MEVSSGGLGKGRGRSIGVWLGVCARAMEMGWVVLLGLLHAHLIMCTRCSSV